MMAEPEVKRQSLFVRRSGGGLAFAQVAQFADGAVLLYHARDGLVHKYRDSPEAWGEALRELQQAGYTEL
jgi:hypothetical protein